MAEPLVIGGNELNLQRKAKLGLGEGEREGKVLIMVSLEPPNQYYRQVLIAKTSPLDLSFELVSGTFN